MKYYRLLTKRLPLTMAIAMTLTIPVLAQIPEKRVDSSRSSQTVSTLPEQSIHEPVKIESKEGFWGKLNPFARKKYVRRQLTPLADRANELDEITTENSKMIRDVDARSTEGIRLASLRANEADSHAIAAGDHADTAHRTATQANQHLAKVEDSITNIDQYQTLSEAEVRFRPGQLTLNSKAKAALDELALPLKDQKGYVLEVQGFSSGTSRAAAENSQRLAAAVVRYLVMEHGIPIHRIYTAGMGNAVSKASAATTGGRVEIKLLRNSLASMQPSQISTNAVPK